MLIVCPNCATSYMLDASSVGTAGRTVRCARCRGTWFVEPPPPANDVTAFVDSVIAEAEAEGTTVRPAAAAPADETPPPPFPPAPDDFGIAPQDPPAGFDSPATWDAPQPAFDAAPEPAPLAISDAPSLVPENDAAVAPVPELPQEDVETVASRRKRLQSKRKRKRFTSRWTAAILVLLAFNVALVGARNDVVRFLPQTASLFAAIGLPVNLRNLAFEKVKITKEVQEGVAVLMIDGLITNTSNKPVDVPRLRFAARNAAGQEIYVWTAKADRSILVSGESLRFTSRLAAPPDEATDVMVRFFTARDAEGGLK